MCRICGTMSRMFTYAIYPQMRESLATTLSARLRDWFSTTLSGSRITWQGSMRSPSGPRELFLANLFYLATFFFGYILLGVYQDLNPAEAALVAFGWLGIRVA
jgi:hypothetical protein